MKKEIMELISQIKKKTLFKYVYNLSVKKLAQSKKISQVYFFIFKNRINKTKLFLMLKSNYSDADTIMFFESFAESGKIFLNFLKKYFKLKPNERLLDIGCGPGRIAFGLTRFLTSGAYEGIDIVPGAIKYCRENITKYYPQFHFQFVDIYNKWYNPKGKFQSSNYKFPFKEESFDCILLVSVFTHMLPDGLNNYLSEISRLLKKNGRCLITFFLLNYQSQYTNKKLSVMDFKYIYDGYRTINKDYHEMAVGYDESDIRSLFKKYSLTIIEPIYYNINLKYNKQETYQDILIAKKSLISEP